MMTRQSSIRYLLAPVIISAVVGLFAPAFPAAAAGAGPVITKARVGAHGEITRFVLEADRAFPYRIFILTNPYRVVVDLPEVSWRAQPPRLNAAAGLVANYRYGLFRPGNSRVVIDVNAPVAIERHFFLASGTAQAPGQRLVLDIRGITPAAFATAPKSFASPKWKALAPERAGKPATAPPRRRKGGRRVVVIDPGHGGVDPGAIGRTGIFEKHITFKVAKAVKRKLEATGRYRVLLTRNRDVYVSLRKRFKRAEDAGAELFISLHADTIKNRRIRGASVYTLSEKSSDKEAEALAAKENRADVIAGVDLSTQSDDVASILISLRQRNTMDESAHLARFLVKRLARNIKLLRNTHRFAGFAVLKSPDVPSVLVELGYLSNRKEERLLRSKKFRRRVALSILRAADEYFKRKDRLSKS